MSASIGMELELMAMSFLLGILLMAAYDLLRLFRLLIPHGNFWIGLEDFFYCLSGKTAALYGPISWCARFFPWFYMTELSAELCLAS